MGKEETPVNKTDEPEFDMVLCREFYDAVLEDLGAELKVTGDGKMATVDVALQKGHWLRIDIPPVAGHTPPTLTLTRIAKLLDDLPDISYELQLTIKRTAGAPAQVPSLTTIATWLDSIGNVSFGTEITCVG